MSRCTNANTPGNLTLTYAYTNGAGNLVFSNVANLSTIVNNGISMIDNGSRKGTWVTGEPVETTALLDGDVIAADPGSVAPPDSSTTPAAPARPPGPPDWRYVDTAIAFGREHGMTVIAPQVGDRFDPALHQAMFEAPLPGTRAGDIIQVVGSQRFCAPLAATYFNYRKTTIYGGSNEVQRNIVAQTVLGS